MKNKKLIPFIMGCAMLLGTSLSVSAAPITGANSQDRNEFTKYNTAQGDTTTKIFTTDEVVEPDEPGTSIGNGTINLSETGGSGTSVYGTRDYTKGGTGSANVENVDPDSVTNLWTTISTYTLKVPSRTVIPLGASKWNIGQVEIVDGKYFLNPDKVKVDISTQPMYLDGDSTNTSANKKINYDVRTSNTAVPQEAISATNTANGAAQRHIYFYYNGEKGDAFPYTYTNFDKTTYNGNHVAEINQGQHVWVCCNDWSGKTSGVYKGIITFTATMDRKATNELDQQQVIIPADPDADPPVPETMGLGTDISAYYV